MHHAGHQCQLRRAISAVRQARQQRRATAEVSCLLWALRKDHRSRSESFSSKASTSHDWLDLWLRYRDLDQHQTLPLKGFSADLRQIPSNMNMKWSLSRVPNEDLGDPHPHPQAFLLFSFVIPRERNLGFSNSPNPRGSQKLKWGIPLPRGSPKRKRKTTTIFYCFYLSMGSSYLYL